MHKFLIAAIAAFGLFVIGCNDAAKAPARVANTAPVKPATPAVQQNDGHDEQAVDEAPRITLAEAKKDFDTKSAVFVDTHTQEQFDMEHIPGAINIQANLIKFEMNKVPKGKKIIAYCS